MRFLGATAGGLSVGKLGFRTVGVKMSRDERRGIGVFAITELVGFPRVRELVCISAGLSVENAPDGIIAGDVRVEARTVAANFRRGGTGSGNGWWGRRACNHTSRGNIGQRWGRRDMGGRADSL